jgi:hypothetical protein
MEINVPGPNPNRPRIAVTIATYQPIRLGIINRIIEMIPRNPMIKKKLKIMSCIVE